MFFEDKVGIKSKAAPPAPKPKPIKAAKTKPTKTPAPKPQKELIDLWGDSSISTATVVAPVLPGQSFNPDPSDYRKVLELAAEPEFAKIKELEQMQEKLKTLDQDYIHPDESDHEPVQVDPIRRSGRRKKKSERNKAARRQEEQKKLLQEMHNAQMLEQIDQIDSIKDELIVPPKQKKPAREPRLLDPYEPLPMEILLPEELESSLRRLRPQGNSFADRFNLLQKKRYIEVRNRQRAKIRKARFKYTESHDYKRFNVESAKKYNEIL